MTTATQTRATLMRHRKADLVNEVMSLRQQLGEMETTRDGPNIAGVSDITESKQAEEALRKSEERFRGFAEIASDWFWEMDENLCFSYLSERFTEITGLPAEHLLGKTRLESNLVEDENLKLNIADLEAHRPFHNFVHSRTLPDGHVTHLITSGMPIFDAEGNFKGYLGTGRDITKRKRAEEKLLEARSELEFRVEQRTSELRQEIVERQNAEKKLRNAEKMQALGTLAGGIAHNFNNALVPIRALSELVMEEFPKESPNRKRLAEIIGGAKRAQELVAQIMSFSRQDEGKPENIDPYELVQGSMLLIHSIAPATVKIIERFDKDVGEVLADKAQIESVILNLVSNAFDAMEGKQGKLEITLSPVELEKDDIGFDADLEEGRYAKLRFIDTGAGMDEKCMKHIFDPFFTTKKVGAGTGLGLSSAYGIVSNHGGSIKVSSTLGAGTTFDVYLPLVATDVEQEVSARGG